MSETVLVPLQHNLIIRLQNVLHEAIENKAIVSPEVMVDIIDTRANLKSLLEEMLKDDFNAEAFNNLVASSYLHSTCATSLDVTDESQAVVSKLIEIMF